MWQFWLEFLPCLVGVISQCSILFWMAKGGANRRWTIIQAKEGETWEVALRSHSPITMSWPVIGSSGAGQGPTARCKNAWSPRLCRFCQPIDSSSFPTLIFLVFMRATSQLSSKSAVQICQSSTSEPIPDYGPHDHPVAGFARGKVVSGVGHAAVARHWGQGKQTLNGYLRYS